MSVEEAEPYIGAMREHNLDTVFLAAPTSTDRRLELVAQVFERLRLSRVAHRRHGRTGQPVGGGHDR